MTENQTGYQASAQCAVGYNCRFQTGPTCQLCTTKATAKLAKDSLQVARLKNAVFRSDERQTMPPTAELPHSVLREQGAEPVAPIIPEC
jgi:hypothetical protein